jgi:hypothetical protein
MGNRIVKSVVFISISESAGAFENFTVFAGFGKLWEINRGECQIVSGGKGRAIRNGIIHFE